MSLPVMVTAVYRSLRTQTGHEGHMTGKHWLKQWGGWGSKLREDGSNTVAT